MWLMNSRWFFPKFLRMFVLIVMSLPLKYKLVFLGVACVLIGMMLYASPQQVEATMDAHFLLIDSTLKGVAFSIAGFTLWRARGHHACEHMAISAHEQHGQMAPQYIHEASRVHRHCGGRYLFPGICIGGVGAILRVYAHQDVVVFVSLGLFELLLWLDTFVGLHNIAVMNKATTLLQLYVTTRPPTSDELEVGKAALSALIDAHKSI
jgi:uncharacterized protein YqhQ